MDNIKIIQYKNKYNYTIRQLKIDYKTKIFQIGSFTIGADETTTKKYFYNKIEELKKMGFLEV